MREEGLEPPRLAALEPKDSLSARGDAEPQENRGPETRACWEAHGEASSAHPRVPLSDPVDLALARALEAATNAAEWAVVAQLAGELAVRRIARQVPGTVSLEAAHNAVEAKR